MRILFFAAFFLFSLVFANDALNTLKNNDAKIMQIDIFLNNPNNLWMKKYSNFVAYNQVTSKLSEIEKQIRILKNEDKDENARNKLNNLERNLNTLKTQQELLAEYKDAPFRELLAPAKLEKAPNITNPILIIQAFSYMNQAKSKLNRLENNYQDLINNLNFLKEKDRLLRENLNLFSDENTAKILQNTCKSGCLYNSYDEIIHAITSNFSAIEELESASNILNTTLAIFSKNVEEINLKLKEQIKAQIIKGSYIGFIILILFGIAFFIKLGVKKYIHDNERIYLTNKIINIINLTIIILLLLFTYLDNVTYLVTVLGFASAGLAIAMKDWFMSLFGWIVIIVGGAVHVGDRIKVIKDGALYVGDVLDISILRITLYEDITYTSYSENRRAGRIIFVPNNFVFTTMFSNYTHGGMRTVWDGIDFTITFESDHTKACSIARECAKKYSKGYVEQTRKQFKQLRDKYSLRSTNVEPRIFTLLEPNGIRISVWYLTNAYATLTLRSSISAEIIDEILKEPNIKIAYPSTTVYSGDSKTPFNDGNIPPIQSSTI